MNYSAMMKSSTTPSLGTVLALFLSKNSVDKIKVDKLGVINDRFYNKDIERSILISSIDSYEMAYEKDIPLTLGKLGENIVLDYNPYSLKPGTKIAIGDVIIEITQRCTLCKSLTKIDPKLPKLLKNDRGLFVKVIQSGSIKLKDKIYIV